MQWKFKCYYLGETQNSITIRNVKDNSNKDLFENHNLIYKNSGLYYYKILVESPMLCILYI